MLNKKDGTTDWGAIISWIVLIIIVVIGIYSMGKNSNKKLTPQEINAEKSNCYQWYGKEACNNPNFNPK